MEQLMRLLIILLTILSYVLAFITAFFPILYLWIPICVLLALFGIVMTFKYIYCNRGVVSVAIFTNGTFVALGQYLETIVPAISFLVNLLGVLVSFLMMLIFYYYKEGKKFVQIRVKHELKKEQEEPPSLGERIRTLFLILRLMCKYKKKYKTGLAFKFAYVEYREQKEKKKNQNAVDFILGREVILERNEYDKTANR